MTTLQEAAKRIYFDEPTTKYFYRKIDITDSRIILNYQGGIRETTNLDLYREEGEYVFKYEVLSAKFDAYSSGPKCNGEEFSLNRRD